MRSIQKTVTALAIALLAGPLAATGRAETAANPTAPAAKPTEAAANPTAIPVAAWTTDCEKYTAAIAGGAKDKDLLDKSEFQTVANKVFDLVTCGAVKADSDALCKVLKNEQEAKACRAKRSTFHELKTNPKGRAFMFNDTQWEDCQRFEPLKPHCDAFRAAARAGDASKCAAMGEVQSLCRATLTLDKSLCQAIKGGKFDEKEKGSSETYGQQLAKDCVKQIESMADYGKGLNGLAEGGSKVDSELAKAALGQADACKSWATAAMPICTTTLEQGGGMAQGSKAPAKPAAK